MAEVLVLRYGMVTTLAMAFVQIGVGPDRDQASPNQPLLSWVVKRRGSCMADWYSLILGPKLGLEPQVRTTYI